MAPKTIFLQFVSEYLNLLRPPGMSVSVIYKALKRARATPDGLILSSAEAEDMAWTYACWVCTLGSKPNWISASLYHMSDSLYPSPPPESPDVVMPTPGELRIVLPPRESETYPNDDRPTPTDAFPSAIDPSSQTQ